MSSSGGASVLLVLAVLAPVLGAVGTLALNPRLGERAAVAATATAGVALAAAVALLVLVGLDGRVFLVAGDGAGADPGLTAGRVAAVLLVLVTLVGLVVQVFARRYLQGDPRHARFFALTSAAVASTAAMIAAATLSVLAVAWVIAGASLVALLAHERTMPAARRAARRATVCFTIGDGALVLAAVLVIAVVGDLNLRDTTAAAAQIDGQTVAGLSLPAITALLIVVAALARSAQVPLGSWLPGTVAAPTPVSALLHAGIVNAGGILVVTLSPLLVLAPGAILLAFAAGAVTALLGTALMLARADVKGELAHSTMGQMGFMMIQASIGALGAAIFHLVAHGMFKATLFLGSGSVIHDRERLRHAPASAPALGGTRAALRDAAIAVLFPLALIAAAVTLIAPGLEDKPGWAILLAFAWASAAQAAFWWLRARRSGLGRAVLPALGLAAAIAGYVLLLDAVGTFLAPDLPAAASGAWAPSWLVLPVLALAAAVVGLRWTAEISPQAGRALEGRLAGAHRTLYALVRRAGEVPDTARALPARMRGAGPATPRPTLDPTPARSL